MTEFAPVLSFRRLAAGAAILTILTSAASYMRSGSMFKKLL